MKQITGDFYELIIAGANVLRCKKGVGDVPNYLLDVRKINYKAQFSTDGRDVNFVRIEGNELVSEYSCNKNEAGKYFADDISDERLSHLRAKENQIGG